MGRGLGAARSLRQVGGQLLDLRLDGGHLLRKGGLSRCQVVLDGGDVGLGAGNGGGDRIQIGFQDDSLGGDIGLDRADGGGHVRPDDRLVRLDDDTQLGHHPPGAALRDVGRDDDWHDAALGHARRFSLRLPY